MTVQHDTSAEHTDLVRGLPMFVATDPQALAQEKAELAKLERKGFVRRWRGYFSMTGPGWLQSALTLGGGSAVASLFAGSYAQYGLLWVQPVAIILGIIMLSAISHQTLSTGVILWKYMGPWVAVPTSAVCGLLLPLAYIIFFILHNSKKYLGPAKHTGLKAVLWNVGMLAALLTSVASACYYIYTNFF